MSRKPNLQQLECFVALAAEGSFAAAAERLHKSQTAVFTAIKGLEEVVGLPLLDRAGYRVELNEAGRAFHDEARQVLRAHAALARRTEQLRDGSESEIRIAIGDLCPVSDTLAPLSAFFASQSSTRAVFRSETLGGPWACLVRGEVDLAIHHLDQPRPEFERLPLFDVRVIPVAAPGFLPHEAGTELAPADLTGARQCVIRDSAADWQAIDYHLIEGAPTVSVSDQATKLELILQGLAWGHMPEHLVASALSTGHLRDLSNPHLPGTTLRHYALRRQDARRGPVASSLWEHLRQTQLL